MSDENINKFSTKKLCEIIICNRYLGVYADLITKCMEELSKRRENGDDFNFEEFIETEMNKLPNISIAFKKTNSIEDLFKMISKVIKK